MIFYKCLRLYLCRKNYARSIESMQASLDVEIKARADAVRLKKKFETQLNDAELQLEHANRSLLWYR